MAAPIIVDAETPSADSTQQKVVKPKAVKTPKPVAESDGSNGVAVESNGAAVESNGTVDASAVESSDDAKTFVFTPTVGDDRSDIRLPLDFSKPDFNNPLDRIWLFDLGDLPPHERMWVWIRRAQVPRMTAHRVVALPLDEQVRCIEDWLSAAQGVGSGE